MKKITVAILVVLAAICLCSCATNNVTYPRIYTITEESVNAVLKDSLSKIPADAVAAFGGEEALENAIRKQIPADFLTITLINESRATMMVSLEGSTNVVEGTVNEGVVTFDIEGVKDSYKISKNWSSITGNLYGIDVKLIYDET